MNVAGKRVLVTGAAQGLGFAIADAFARAGARVVVTDLGAARVSAAVAKLPCATGFALDVTNPEQIADVRAKLAPDPIDVLVNNAGVVFGGPFLDVPLAKHLATINVNLSGLVAVTHAFLPDLLARPAAHVVNICSASAVIALPHGTSYAATKWAVLGFTESVREELWVQKRANVTVTAVCPGFITTGLFGGAKPASGASWLTPESVAAAVVRAVQKRREFVMLPRAHRVLYALTAGLPRGVYRWLCRRTGVSHSMVGWTGHAK
jgi:short-subunit dehydrogenase